MVEKSFNPDSAAVKVKINFFALKTKFFSSLSKDFVLYFSIITAILSFKWHCIIIVLGVLPSVANLGFVGSPPCLKYKLIKPRDL